MKFIKYIFFLICLTTFLIGFYNNSISLGQTWQKLHTNSLIGFQKLIEKSLFEEILYINFWFDIATSTNAKSLKVEFNVTSNIL